MDLRKEKKFGLEEKQSVEAGHTCQKIWVSKIYIIQFKKKEAG